MVYVLSKRLLLLPLFLFLNSYAQQGNYNFNNFGNKSILLSGNVTGSVEDLAVGYYNPARLTEIENNSFSVNAKVYQLSKLRLKDAIGNDVSFKDSDFKGIPSMIAGTFTFKNQKFAYTLLSKSSNETNLNYTTITKVKDILDEFIGDETYSGTIQIKSKSSEEWLGLSWADSINDRLNIGFSTFVSVYNEQGESEFDYTIQHSQNTLVASYKNKVRFEQTTYGVFLKAGLNYNFNKATLGLTLTLPHIGVWNNGEFYYKEVIAGIGPDKDLLVTDKENNLKAARRTPLSIAVGSGIQLGKHKLHLNATCYSGIKNYDRIEIPTIPQENKPDIAFQLEESAKPIFNFGVGSELYIHKSIKGYLSFATDYSAYISNANLINLNSQSKKDINFSQDFYHFGGGFELKFQSIQLILGTSYTRSSSVFSKPIEIESDLGKESSNITYQQWQFIVGLEIPVFGKKIQIK
ncbi:hypothetical protein [uncultured Flavobacterium sp.]|nr:hypothetical protein [uncultured Flavobacterium sp.]